MGFVDETAAPARPDAPPDTSHRRRRTWLRRYLQPRTGVTLVIWRVEAYSATPLAILLIATLGRWPGALAMGAVMAVFAAVFLFLLEEDPVLEDLRAWGERRSVGRVVNWLAEREDGVGRARRGLALVPGIMFLGPFWRAVAFHMFRLRRLPAYVLSVGGSFPHALLWTGLVLGGIWEGFVWPWLRDF